jgi:hypothetical protein
MPQKLLTSSYVNHTQLFTVLQLLRHSLGLVDVKKPSSSPMQEPDTKQSGSLAVSFFLSFFIQPGIQKIISNKRYKVSSYIFAPQVLALRQLAWASRLFLGVALSCYMYYIW